MNTIKFEFKFENAEINYVAVILLLFKITFTVSFIQ